MRDQTISVIIPTLNRKNSIEKLVTLIVNEQTYRGFEIIIVDQSDSYDISKEESILRPLIPKEIVFKYIAMELKNLPMARNRGISESSGDILLFLDDDTEPSSDLFYQHLISYGISKEIGIVSGRVMEEGDIHTNTRKRLGGHVSFTGRVFMNFASGDSGFISYASGCNMSLKKKVITEVGHFDRRFIGTAHYEDADYSYRARGRGYKIFYNGKAAIKHLLLPSGGCRDEFSKREYFVFHNLGRFCRKHYPIILFPTIVFFEALRIAKKASLYSRILKDRVIFFKRTLIGLIKGYIEGKRA